LNGGFAKNVANTTIWHDLKLPAPFLKKNGKFYVNRYCLNTETCTKISNWNVTKTSGQQH